MAFQIFQRGLSSAPGKPQISDLWREFSHKGLPFFLGDVRTRREARTAADWRCRRIMNAEQEADLLAWLVREDHADKPKFVATSSAVLPRHLNVALDSSCGFLSDSWDGYPASLHGLLAFVYEDRVEGLVFLSGDEHMPIFVRATIARIDAADRRSVVIHSVHSSGLYSPYPFANGSSDDFMPNETFRFPDPEAGPYECSVETEFPDPANGFAILKAENNSGSWDINVDFYRADGEQKPTSKLTSWTFRP